jgi:glycerol-3-phosphate acyltransferase PlsX
MNVGMELVRDGKADAIVSMGNTGAFLAYSLRTLKRIKNVYRPAFPTIIPSRTGHFFISDSGANADCKPEWLVQFGIMTSIYAEQVLRIHNPRVGLLSNGEEEGKGNELTRLTRDLMEEADFNFIGNVEPKEALGGGVDVMITDGFTGNIVLKTLEAAARSMSELIKEEIMASTLTKVGGFLATPAFNRVRKKTDPFEIGGAPMLGVNGVVIAGHGRSNDIAIKNAINQAQKAVQSGVIDAITEKMSTWDKSQHKSSGEES